MKKRGLILALALGAALTLLSGGALGAQEVIPIQYDSVEAFCGGVSVVTKDGKKGLVDTAGKEIVPLGSYESIGTFSEGLGPVYRDGKWGYIDATGREVISCTLDYIEAGPFYEGRAAVANGDRKYGFIDRTGRETVPCRYIQVLDFSEGLAAVMDDGWGVGFIDLSGQEAIPCRYSWAEPFSEGRAVVKGAQEKWGVIDRTGREVVPCQYLGVHDFSQGLALVIDFPNRRGYIDQEGTVVIPIQYETSGDFSDGVAVVSSLDGEGQAVIDRTGREIVPFGRYSYIGDFSEGLAAVIDQAGSYGYINAGGEEVIPCRYSYGGAFSEGYAVVSQYDTDGEQKYGYIDRTGREAAPCAYDQAEAVSEGLGIVGIYTGEYADCYLRLCRWGAISLDSGMAYPSEQTVMVNGESVALSMYARTDSRGGQTNYVRLRDVAAALHGTAAQFQVEWTGAVEIETGKGYVPDGSEGDLPFSGERSYEYASAATRVDGEDRALEAIILKDDRGGAYTYYKLRDLGAVLGFQVDWSPEKGIWIETE